MRREFLLRIRMAANRGYEFRSARNRVGKIMGCDGAGFRRQPGIVAHVSTPERIFVFRFIVLKREDGRS